MMSTQFHISARASGFRAMLSLAALIATWLLLSGSAIAQPAAKGEAENLVPPGGAAFDVPVHAGEVCILSFPGEKMAGSALASSANFDIKAWGSDGVAVRPTGKAAATTLALATVSGAIKINVTPHVVPAAQEALPLVRFKPASSEEAFEARVAAEVAKRTAPLEAELAKTKRGIDAQIRDLLCSLSPVGTRPPHSLDHRNAPSAS